MNKLSAKAAALDEDIYALRDRATANKSTEVAKRAKSASSMEILKRC